MKLIKVTAIQISLAYLSTLKKGKLAAVRKARSFFTKIKRFFFSVKACDCGKLKDGTGGDLDGSGGAGGADDGRRRWKL